MPVDVVGVACKWMDLLDVEGDAAVVVDTTFEGSVAEVAIDVVVGVKPEAEDASQPKAEWTSDGRDEDQVSVSSWGVVIQHQ